jgi:hypothetical protein
MYDRLGGVIPELQGRRPELFVTYSVERHTEFVQLDDAPYIVFDQHLGQTFNFLNRVLLHTDGPMLGLGFSFRYAAQRLRTLGSDNLAMILALSWAKIRDEQPLPTLAAEDPAGADLRRTLTYLQESYIFLHEIAHYLFSVDAELRSKYEEFVRDRVAGLVATSEPTKIKELRAAIWHHANLETCEEMMCDFFATERLLLTQVRVAPAWTVYAGVVLAFKYLRMLSLLEVSVANTMDRVLARPERYAFGWTHKLTGLFAPAADKVESEMLDQNQTIAMLVSQFREVLVRGHAWELLQLFPELELPSESTGPPNGVADAIPLLERFDEVLEYPAWVMMPEKLRMLIAKGEHRVAMTTPQRAAAHEMIDKATGWI